MRLLLTMCESRQDGDVDTEKADEIGSTHLVNHRHKRTEPRHPSAPTPNIRNSQSLARK